MSRSIYLRTAVLLLFPLALTVAQPPAAAEKSSATPPAAPRDPAVPVSEPAVPPTPPAAPATPATPATSPADAAKEDDRSKLRDIGQVEVKAEEERAAAQPRRNRRGNGGDFPFGEHTVSPGGHMREVVSVLGSTTVGGSVDSDAVSVLGNTRILPGAKVGGAAVAVLGRLESEGEIGDEAVSVLGSATINGPVGGEAVAVLGNMWLGPKAVIGGDVVVVGGRLTKDPGAIVNGNEVRVPIFGPFGNVDWLTTWLTRCVFYGRLLAIGPNLGWAWAVAIAFLVFYLLLALLFSDGVVKCAQTLETQPGRSVLTSVLTVLLTPVAVVLLAVTVVGALLVPFLGAGLLFAGLFGKTVMLAWIGRRFTKFFGDGPLGHPAFAVLIGGLIVLPLYAVPVVGLLTYKLLSWLGLGVVVYTVALSMKRDRPRLPGAPAPTPLPYVPSGPDVPETYPSSASFEPRTSPSSSYAGVVSAPMMSAGFSEQSQSGTELPRVEAGPAPMPASADDPGAAGTPLPPPVVPSSGPETPPPFSSALPPPVSPPRPPRPPRNFAPVVGWPRAGFFLRLGALAIDGVLIGLIMAFLSGLLPRAVGFNHGPGPWLLALAIYGALMWKHKGTTIGGIVCGLKVVRTDNREVDWATAIVRALACFLSLAVAGLGFIWIAIDEENQSWHDKIAGTAVVVVPKGVSLV